MPAGELDELLIRIQKQLDKMKESLRMRRSDQKPAEKSDEEKSSAARKNTRPYGLAEKNLQRN